jgi:hypothetical protein
MVHFLFTKRKKKKPPAPQWSLLCILLLGLWPLSVCPRPFTESRWAKKSFHSEFQLSVSFSFSCLSI